MKHSRARLAHEIRQRITGILSQRTGDPRLAEVLVNDVRVAPDGSYARIFWGTLGPTAAVAEALEKAKPYLRRCLAAELKIRRVPELDFRLDETLARAGRVEEVLRELEAERAAKQAKEEPA